MGTSPESLERTEAEIVRGARKGSRDDFRLLVLAYQDRIFSLIMRQVRDHAAAKELAQDVFLRAYRGLPSFQERSSFSTWLTRIALNVANSYFSSRRFKERQRTTFLDPQKFDGFPVTCEEPSPEESLQKLQGCIHKLKTLYRDAITLCFLEGKAYAEAAEILEIPAGTVASRINKAFQLLRYCFSQE